MNISKKHDEIITAYAQRACGPGWANAPIWVVVKDRRDGRIREECIQPEEQTALMVTLYPFSENAHAAMVQAVFEMVGGRK